MSQEEDDKLDALWRRASAAEAERPAARTRAAILAEAAAAARRREPAANAPRYWMRMVAGVAVVGVGLVLWRQTQVQLPGEMPVAAPMAQELALEENAAAGVAAATEEVEKTGEAEAREDAQADAAAPPATQAFDNATTRSRESPRAPQPQPQPQPQPSQPQLQAPQPEMKVAQQRAPAMEASPGADLLRQHFPAQNASAQPHRLWVVLDAEGAVQLSGELAAGEQLADLAPRIRSATSMEPGNWRVETLENEQGQRIELAILRLPR